MKAREAFESILWAAVMGFPGGDTRRAVDMVSDGREIPDKLLPGRLVMRMPPETRAALAALTSEDTQDRVGDWIGSPCDVCARDRSDCKGRHM